MGRNDPAKKYVEVSVRPLVESESSNLKSPQESRSHDRYQVLDTLVPTSGSPFYRAEARSESKADYHGVTNAYPIIEKDAHLVLEDDQGNDKLVLYVLDTNVRGRKRHLELEKRAPIQPVS